MNPYEPTLSGERTVKAKPIRGHMAAALPLLLPISALASVIAVVILERDFNVKGAILGSFSTPMGILFTFAAFMYLGFVAWMPSGFLFSVLFALRCETRWTRFAYPFTFVLLCLTCFAFAALDPDGMFTYFMD